MRELNTHEIQSVSGGSIVIAGGIALSTIGGFVSGMYRHDFYQTLLIGGIVSGIAATVTAPIAIGPCALLGVVATYLAYTSGDHYQHPPILTA